MSDPTFNGNSPCRERTDFPWKGMVVEEVTLNDVALRKGTLLTVSAKEGPLYQVSVDNDDSLKGTVPVASVDEALCATIAESLLGRESITWGPGGEWRQCWFARQALTLNGVDLPSGTKFAGVVPVKGEERKLSVNFRVDGTWADGEVDADLVEHREALPDLDVKITMLCYEFPAYAAQRAGLYSGFMSLADRSNLVERAPGVELADLWLNEMRCTFTGGPITYEGLAEAAFQPGDIIVFYDTYNFPAHVAVASGDGHDTYSLWNKPKGIPTKVSIETLWKIPEHPPVHYIKTARPGWHGKS